MKVSKVAPKNFVIEDRDKAHLTKLVPQTQVPADIKKARPSSKEPWHQDAWYYIPSHFYHVEQSFDSVDQLRQKLQLHEKPQTREIAAPLLGGGGGGGGGGGEAPKPESKKSPTPRKRPASRKSPAQKTSPKPSPAPRKIPAQKMSPKPIPAPKDEHVDMTEPIQKAPRRSRAERTPTNPQPGHQYNLRPRKAQKSPTTPRKSPTPRPTRIPKKAQAPAPKKELTPLPILGFGGGGSSTSETSYSPNAHGVNYADPKIYDLILNYMGTYGFTEVLQVGTWALKLKHKSKDEFAKVELMKPDMKYESRIQKEWDKMESYKQKRNTSRLPIGIRASLNPVRIGKQYELRYIVLSYTTGQKEIYDSEYETFEKEFEELAFEMNYHNILFRDFNPELVVIDKKTGLIHVSDLDLVDDTTKTSQDHPDYISLKQETENHVITRNDNNESLFFTFLSYSKPLPWQGKSNTERKQLKAKLKGIPRYQADIIRNIRKGTYHRQSLEKTQSLIADRNEKDAPSKKKTVTENEADDPSKKKGVTENEAKAAQSKKIKPKPAESIVVIGDKTSKRQKKGNTSPTQNTFGVDYTKDKSIISQAIKTFLDTESDMKSKDYKYLANGMWGMVFKSGDSKTIVKVEIMPIINPTFPNLFGERTIMSRWQNAQPKHLPLVLKNNVIQPNRTATITIAGTNYKLAYLEMPNYGSPEKSTNLSEKDAKGRLLQIIEALNELHKFKVVHSDMSSQNILFDAKKEAHLIDFYPSQISFLAKKCPFQGTPSFSSLRHDQGFCNDYVDNIESAFFIVWSYIADLPWKNTLKQERIKLKESLPGCPTWLKDLIIQNRKRDQHQTPYTIKF